MPVRQFYQIHSINCYYIRRYTDKYQRRVYKAYYMKPDRNSPTGYLLKPSLTVGFNEGNEFGYALGVF